jgi:uncharacterized membrane protein
VAVIPGLSGELFNYRRGVVGPRGHHRVLGTSYATFHPYQSLLLMVVSFLPFPTKLLAEYVGEDRPERVAATIYGLNLFLTAVLVSVLWRYAVREGLIRPNISDAGVKTITKKLTPGLVGYVVMILLGLFLPVLAVLGYLIIAIYNMIPFGALRRHHKAVAQAS